MEGVLIMCSNDSIFLPLVKGEKIASGATGYSANLSVSEVGENSLALNGANIVGLLLDHTFVSLKVRLCKVTHSLENISFLVRTAPSGRIVNC